METSKKQLPYLVGKAFIQKEYKTFLRYLGDFHIKSKRDKGDKQIA